MSDDNVTMTRDQLRALAIAAERGLALDAWVANVVLLGHASPSGGLDYTHPEEGSATAFIKDFVAWTCGRKHTAPGCEERLREFGAVEARARLEQVGADLATPA